MNSTWSNLENSTFFQNTTTKTTSAEKTNSVLSGTPWDHKKTEDKNKNIIDSHFETAATAAASKCESTAVTKKTAPVNIESVWKLKNSTSVSSKTESSTSSTKSSTKTSWTSEIMDDRDDNEDDTKDDDLDLDANLDTEMNADSMGSSNEPAHHSRRPMNAFLIFCKCHRPVVRQKYPQLENRGVTKILGEWWAQLESDEKTAYQDLAKQYKDAFFKANPNFRWYKLPAPPLRTLNTRPGNVSKSPEPRKITASPTSLTPLTFEAEFTPGKLADESQLGSITSLMNMDTGSHQFPKSTSNNKRAEETFLTVSPQSVTERNAVLPPKPIKKRFLEHVVENKNVSRNIFNEKNNMTHQELIEKVVDNLCSPQNSPQELSPLEETYNGKKEPRKSGRSCKGKRYEKFMVEGKLLGNKKDKKHKSLQNPMDLERTIKRLAERTKVPSPERNDSEFDNNNSISDNNNDGEKMGRERSNSETSTETLVNNYRASDFNLEAKIKALPNLSFDKFLMKKKLAKKKKPAGKVRNGDDAVSGNIPVGSRKRKANKHITRIPSPSNDLSGLATLAEVAAKTAKLDQQ